MESELLIQRISPESISGQTPYGFRFDLRDPVLEASLDRQGVLCPLLLIRGRSKKAVLVSGHKRLSHTLRKGGQDLRASWVEEGFSEKELFLLSLYSNWGQNFQDLDRMEALRKAEGNFGFSEENLLIEVVPALGLLSSRWILVDYRQVAGLRPEIHSLIQSQNLPFRGASSLSRFSGGEQLLLAENVFGRLHLTTNQLIRIGEWLSDLRKGRKASLESILQEKELRDVLALEYPDLRTRGERFFAALRSLRYPRITGEENRLRGLKAQIEEAEGISLHWPENREKDDLFLTVRLRRRSDLERIFRFIETHRSTFKVFLRD